MFEGLYSHQQIKLCSIAVFSIVYLTGAKILFPSLNPNTGPQDKVCSSVLLIAYPPLCPFLTVVCDFFRSQQHAHWNETDLAASVLYKNRNLTNSFSRWLREKPLVAYNYTSATAKVRAFIKGRPYRAKLCSNLRRSS
jgi:hypothetical protein